MYALCKFSSEKCLELLAYIHRSESLTELEKFPLPIPCRASFCLTAHG